MEAIILAGGLGTRLRGVIGEIPKCMAPIDGKPFLQYQLEWLSRFDVTHVVFSVGYLKEQVIDFVNSREWPFEVSYAVEKEPLGTGGGIRLALSKCRSNLVYILNGDTFFNVDLNALPFTAPVTLALKPMRDFDRYGAVDWNGDLVTGFREKAPCAEGLINGGIYAIDRSQLDMALYPKKFSFEKENPNSMSAIISSRPAYCRIMELPLNRFILFLFIFYSPKIFFKMTSSLNSSRFRIVTMCPSLIQQIRSQIDISSGISEEIMITLIPLRTSSPMMW